MSEALSLPIMDNAWIGGVGSRSGLASAATATWPFAQTRQRIPGDGSNTSSFSSTSQNTLAPANVTPNASIYSLDAPLSSLTPSHHWWEYTKWSDDEINSLLWNHRTVVAAGTASLVSTAASFPVSTEWSRLISALSNTVVLFIH